MATKLTFITSKQVDRPEELLDELERQFTALGIGAVTKKQAPAPKGTLSPDPVTILVVIKIAYWSGKLAKLIYDTVRESRERHAAARNVPIERVAVEVQVSNDDGNDLKAIQLPASETSWRKFAEESGAKDQG